MAEWRERMYKEIREVEFSKTINSPEKIMAFFTSEFNKLIEPIEKEHPDVCHIKKSDSRVDFSIGKSSLELVNDFEDNGIKVYISRISSNRGEKQQWGTIKIEEVTYFEQYLPAIDKGKRIFLDQNLVDDLFEKTFATTWLF
ncbi:hypothetical protein LC048_17885 [Mesobacillus subterraneus]|uniref:hypothetical protein n=1 Tax=Mesobacillus subterraneus TaxID=285983 RepID=UPI001CFE051E|nr:hypothetical protein [Mesobacillus subterraneus]WLR54298.1 hypothetical protein LC048_17885 [Mesobacillus subterraneus]